jgi:hypothetical protein
MTMGNWSVGQIQSVQARHLNGPGFNIQDEVGRPLLCFVYTKEADAVDARNLITKALERAEYVGAPGP